MTKSFNINNTVKVKLTEQGKKLLERDHNEFWGSRGILRDHPYEPPKEDENGYVKFQLWSLMYQLGKYCGLGCEPPFDTVILIDDEDLKMIKYNRPMNIFDKLQSGWYWFGECFDEWCWTMTQDDGEFFNYIQSDYVKYEEDMYYE